MGGVFSIKGTYVPGTNRRERCSALGERTQGFYHQRQVTDRLSNLTVTMIKKNCTSKPKLRCSAAECRALVPFLVELAESVLSDDLLDEPVTVAARSLLDCYMALSSDSVFAEDVLRGSSEKFTQKLVALESVDPGCWSLKPKLHIWLELCASGASPSLFWTYRDEDFGGTCALGTQERRAFEPRCHFQGLARPFLDQGACATPLSSGIFSARSCFSCFRPSQAALGCCDTAVRQHSTDRSGVRMSSHQSLPPPGCAPHQEQLRWHGCTPQFRNFWTTLKMSIARNH